MSVLNYVGHAESDSCTGHKLLPHSRLYIEREENNKLCLLTHTHTQPYHSALSWQQINMAVSHTQAGKVHHERVGKQSTHPFESFAGPYPEHQRVCVQK